MTVGLLFCWRSRHANNSQTVACAACTSNAACKLFHSLSWSSIRSVVLSTTMSPLMACKPCSWGIGVWQRLQAEYDPYEPCWRWIRITTWSCAWACGSKTILLQRMLSLRTGHTCGDMDSWSGGMQTNNDS